MSLRALVKTEGVSLDNITFHLQVVLYRLIVFK